MFTCRKMQETQQSRYRKKKLTVYCSEAYFAAVYSVHIRAKSEQRCAPWTFATCMACSQWVTAVLCSSEPLGLKVGVVKYPQWEHRGKEWVFVLEEERRIKHLGIYEQQILSFMPLFYTKASWRYLKKMSDIRGVNFHQMGEVRNTRKFSSGNILILCVFIKTAAARIKWEINWPKVY